MKNKKYDPVWRGAPLSLFPGRSPDSKLFNRSLIKLRLLHEYASCFDLHGEPLKEELIRLRSVKQACLARGLANERARQLETSNL
jgi:hypothetical protein